MTSQTPSFAPNPFEPMAYWSSRVSVSQAIWVQFSKSTETLCAARPFLRGTEPVSGLTRVFLYYCTLCYFFLLEFRQC